MNEEIFGGLKAALERGESLKKAMLTFYNSGYSKEEIAEAARALEASVASSANGQAQPTVTQTPQQPRQNTPTSNGLPQYSSSQQQSNQTTTQKVSNYSEDVQDKTLIYVLIGILVFLLGALVSIFVFKDQLITFFSSFFN